MIYSSIPKEKLQILYKNSKSGEKHKLYTERAKQVPEIRSV